MDVNINPLISSILTLTQIAADKKSTNTEIRKEAENVLKTISNYKLKEFDSFRKRTNLINSITKIKEFNSPSFYRIKSNYPVLLKIFLTGAAVFSICQLQVAMVMRQLNFIKALQHLYHSRGISKAMAIGSLSALAFFLRKSRQERNQIPALLDSIERELYSMVQIEDRLLVSQEKARIFDLSGKYPERNELKRVIQNEDDLFLNLCFRITYQSSPESCVNSLC